MATIDAISGPRIFRCGAGRLRRRNATSWLVARKIDAALVKGVAAWTRPSVD